MKQELRSKILETRPIDWKKAKWFQNESLKKLAPDAMQKLKSSLVANDFIMPFHVWEENESNYHILDGHHRQLALLELERDGVEVPQELPGTFIDCIDEKEAAKFVLVFSSAYAKMQKSGLDEFMEIYDIDITDIIGEIELPDFSINRFEQDYDNREIADPEPNDIPVEEVIVQAGDWFGINGHQIYCGDTFDQEQWNRMLNGEQVRMVLTDPPYNLSADDIGNLGSSKHEDFAVAAGEMSEVEFRDFLQKVMQLSCEISTDGALHYIWMDWRHVWHMTDAAQNVYDSPIPKQMIVWAKDTPGMGSFYRSKHELCFVFKHGKEAHRSHVNLMDRIRFNVWNYPSGNSRKNPDWQMIREHPTPKPVKMFYDAILDVTNPGDIVVDYFLGSGTTLLAADQSDRVAICTEIQPHYVQLAINRYLLQCKSANKPVSFTHKNGSLKLQDFEISNRIFEKGDRVDPVAS